MQSCLTREVVLGLNTQLSIYIVKGLTGHPFADNSLPCPAVGTGAAATQKVQLIRQTAETVQLEHTGAVFIPSKSTNTPGYLGYTWLRATWSLCTIKKMYALCVQLVKEKENGKKSVTVSRHIIKSHTVLNCKTVKLAQNAIKHQDCLLQQLQNLLLFIVFHKAVLLTLWCIISV